VDAELSDEADEAEGLRNQNYNTFQESLLAWSASK